MAKSKTLKKNTFRRSDNKIDIAVLYPWDFEFSASNTWKDPRGYIHNPGCWSFTGPLSFRSRLLEYSDNDLGSWFREHILSAPEWSAEERRLAEGKGKPRGKSLNTSPLVLDLSHRAFAVHYFLKDEKKKRAQTYGHLKFVFRKSYSPKQFRAVTPTLLTAFVIQDHQWSDHFKLKKPLENPKHFANTYIYGHHRIKGGTPSAEDLHQAHQTVCWTIANYDPPPEWLLDDEKISKKDYEELKLEEKVYPV